MVAVKTGWLLRFDTSSVNSAMDGEPESYLGRATYGGSLFLIAV